MTWTMLYNGTCPPAEPPPPPPPPLIGCARIQENAPIWASLVACWDMEESAGTRVDHVGVFHLTPAGSIGSATGKHNNAADFAGGYLHRAPDVDLNPPFTIAMWFKLRSFPLSDHMVLMSIGRSTAGGDYKFVLEILLELHTLFVSAEAGAGGVIGSTAGALILNNWYFVTVRHNNSTLFLQLNNGTIDSASGSGTSGVVGDFGIGVITDGSPINGLFNGWIDTTMVFDRSLTNDECAFLWNGGAG